MAEGSKSLANSGRRLATLLPLLAIAGAVAMPASADADAPFSSGLSLVFAGGKTRSVADNVAVPVECVGSGNGFCSGEVTLSREGHRISIPVSVRGGGKEVLLVPLRVRPTKSHPRKVHGVVTTVQPLGPPTSTKVFLYAE